MNDHDKITMKGHLLMEFVLKEKSTAKPSLGRQQNDLIFRYKWFGEQHRQRMKKKTYT